VLIDEIYGTITKKQLLPILPDYAFTSHGWLNDLVNFIISILNVFLYLLYNLLVVLFISDICIICTL